MQAGRWNATKSIGTTFMRIWRVVFWESEFFEKASQKKKNKKKNKKNQISSGEKKSFS